jgi:uncharacterized membrane protein YqjE
MADEGLLASIKNVTSTFIDIAHTRLDLLCTDMEEERQRLVSLLAMAFVSLFCLCVGVVLLAIFVVVMFWDTHRLLVIGMLTGIFLISGAVLWAVAMHALKTMPRLFAASLAELSKDREQLEAQTSQDQDNPDRAHQDE